MNSFEIKHSHLVKKTQISRLMSKTKQLPYLQLMHKQPTNLQRNGYLSRKQIYQQSEIKGEFKTNNYKVYIYILHFNLMRYNNLLCKDSIFSNMFFPNFLK